MVTLCWKINHILLIFCITFTAVANVFAADATPFSIRNQNPYIQIFGLPATEPAHIMTDHEMAFAVSLDIANNSIFHADPKEGISLDGETYRYAYLLRYGLNSTTEIGFELPYINHSDGRLDNFIENWHDVFGMTNSDRNKTPSNSLDYRYHRNGVTVAGFTEPNQGIGDLRLFAAHRLHDDDNSAMSLHYSLKLPTGDAEELHGSGAADLSFSLAYLKRHWFTPLALSTFANGGVLFLGKGDVISDDQKRIVYFGSTGLIWYGGKLIDLKTQLDAHSRFYHNPLAQLGTPTFQLTVGGAFHFNRTTSLDIGVGENLVTDTTPDFLINLVLKSGY